MHDYLKRGAYFVVLFDGLCYTVQEFCELFLKGSFEMGLFDRFRKKEEAAPAEDVTSYEEIKEEADEAPAEEAPAAEEETPAEQEAPAEEEKPAEEAPAPAPQPQGPRMTPLTKEQLEKNEENGKVLTYLIERHHELKNKDSFLTVLKGLEGTRVWVPMHILLSKRDLDAMRAGAGKEQVKPKDPVRFTPDILKNANGERLYPCFTTRDEIPAEYKKRFQWVLVDTRECIMQTVANERLAALIFNPFTKNFILRREGLAKMVVKKNDASPEENAEAALPEEPHFTS